MNCDANGYSLFQSELIPRWLSWLVRTRSGSLCWRALDRALGCRIALNGTVLGDESFAFLKPIGEELNCASAYSRSIIEIKVERGGSREAIGVFMFGDDTKNEPTALVNR